MMKTGTAEYLGITTGRATPGFVKTMWSPSSRTHRNPSASKTFTNILKETELSFGVREWQRERNGHPPCADELWSFQLASTLQVAGFL